MVTVNGNEKIGALCVCLCVFDCVCANLSVGKLEKGRCKRVCACVFGCVQGLECTRAPVRIPWKIPELRRAVEKGRQSLKTGFKWCCCCYTVHVAAYSPFQAFNLNIAQSLLFVCG